MVSLLQHNHQRRKNRSGREDDITRKKFPRDHNKTLPFKNRKPTDEQKEMISVYEKRIPTKDSQNMNQWITNTKRIFKSNKETILNIKITDFL